MAFAVLLGELWFLDEFILTGLLTSIVFVLSNARLLLLLVDAVSSTSIVEDRPGREQVDFQAMVGSFWDVDDPSELLICLAFEKYCIDRVFWKEGGSYFLACFR